MRQISYCARWSLAAIILSGLICRHGAAETRLDFDTGMWIPFLPDYTAGSIVESFFPNNVVQPDLFRDDQTDLGAQIGASALLDIGDNGWMIELDVDLAGIGSMGSSQTFADPGAGQSVWLASLDGIGFVSTPDGESATFSLDSDVLYNSQYIGLLDRFRTDLPRLGVVDMGFGFRHMQFEQEHLLNAVFTTGFSGQYVEDVDTTYLGGEIRGTLRRRIRGHDVRLDFGVGLFDMDGDYVGTSVLRTGGGAIFDQDLAVAEISQLAATVDLALRLDTEVFGVNVRPGVTFQYISDIPVINHPMTEDFAPVTPPVTLDSDPAYFLGINLEILLACGCGGCWQ